MVREQIRRAQTALQRAAEAHTIEYRVRYCDEARGAFEKALRKVTAKFDAAERRPTAAARTVARRAVAFLLEELHTLEEQLGATESRLADAVATEKDPRDYRRFRLAD